MIKEIRAIWMSKETKAYKVIKMDSVRLIRQQMYVFEERVVGERVRNS